MATSSRRKTTSQPKALGALIREQLMADPQKQKALRKSGGSVVFGVIGDVLGSWLAGETKMVALGRATLSGDPAATYKACGRRGLTIANLKNGSDGEVVLERLSHTLADLTYLLMRGLVAPEPAEYASPAEKNVVAVLDLPALVKRYPDLARDLPVLAHAGRFDPGTLACPAAIAAVDVGVLILDYVRASK